MEYGIMDEEKEEKSKLIIDLNKWFEKSEKNMSAQRKRWRKNERLYYNDMDLDVSDEATQITNALPFAVIQTEMPIISDYLPTYDVMPKQENDISHADMMQDRTTDVDNKDHVRDRQLDAILDAEIYSNALLSVIPVLNSEGELKKFDLTVRDIYTWFPSPGAKGMKLGAECRYHIFATPMHIDSIKERYAEKCPEVEQIKGEGNLDEYQSFNIKNNDSTDSGEATAEFSLLKECFWTDKDKNKYPYGRYTIWCENVLIIDEPLWDGAEVDEKDDYEPPIPVFMVRNYGKANKLFGIGETELVKTQTKFINEAVSNLAEVIRKTGSPTEKVKRGWWEQRVREIKSKFKRILIVDHSEDVTWQDPPQIQTAAFSLIELVLRLMDSTTGMHDVTQGKKPEGITAASAIAELQEAAQGRVRFKIQHEFTPFVLEIGKFITWCIKTYDTQVRTIRQQNKLGQPVFKTFDPAGLKDTQFDIEIVAGESLPSGRLIREKIAMVKFDKGIYGIEQYVNASSETDKKGVIEGYYERQGLKEIQAKQQAMGEAYPQFAQALQQAMTDPGAWIGSPEEEQLIMMVVEMPELLTTDEFKQATPEIKERLFAGFMA